VTARAADRIKELLSGENAKGAVGIRLGVRRRGCNGLSYTLNYAYDEAPQNMEDGSHDTSKGQKDGKPRRRWSSGSGFASKDVEMVAHGVRVWIDPMALFSIVGTTMDWEETELSSEFTFKNPNSKGECGCGESFTV
jgi:iron-sulfur cluster assembly protein